jgi:hypothetical protein
MLNNSVFDVAAFLRGQIWEEGKVIQVVQSSYRTRTTITCYAAGRQKAEFANGPGGYGAYVELTRPDGTWISQGTNFVPVLPDGRILMIVEQRPPQFRLANQPQTLIVGGEQIDLRQFGPYSSVEFPGGAIDPKSKFLDELEEETEVEDQKATVYKRTVPFCPQGSDLALEGFLNIAYLTGKHFSPQVKTDGGLNVLALTPDDVEENIHLGNIRSGQAALMGWAFYQEVERARRDNDYLKKLLSRGYLEVVTVDLKRR